MVHGDSCIISTMVDYADRLKEAMEHASVSTQQLADELGLSYQAVKKVLDGKSKAFNAANNARAAAYLRVNATWLATGAGDKALSSANDATAKPEIPRGALPVDPDKYRRIWVVGKGAGGLPQRIWTDGDYPVGATEYYGEVLSADPQAFLTEVAEDSMIPVFNPKNFALVEPNTPVDLEDRVLVRLTDGTTLIKRLLSRRNGYTFGSYNDPKLLHFSTEDVTWMYYVAFEVPRKKIKSRTG